MYFYSLALLGSPLEFLTYHSDIIVPIGSKVSIKLVNRETHGVILASCEKPSFKTSAIVESLSFAYSEFQIKTAQFMAEYYGCSLGEALNLFVPFPVIACYDTQSTEDTWIPNQVLDDRNPSSAFKNTRSPIKSERTGTITLSSTRDDAMATKASMNLATFISDIGAYYTANGSATASNSNVNLAGDGCFSATFASNGGLVTIASAGSTPSCLIAHSIALAAGNLGIKDFGGQVSAIDNKILSQYFLY